MLVDLDGLKKCARDLANRLEIGDVIFLKGELGAGKTTFSKFLIQALMGEDTPVTSPTFTLVHTYDTPRGSLWHCDLYRLEDPDDVQELGLEEAFHKAICLIEWPERLGIYAPRNHLDVLLEISEDGRRLITIETTGKINESLREAFSDD